MMNFNNLTLKDLEQSISNHPYVRTEVGEIITTYTYGKNENILNYLIVDNDGKKALVYVGKTGCPDVVMINNDIDTDLVKEVYAFIEAKGLKGKGFTFNSTGDLIGTFLSKIEYSFGYYIKPELNDHLFSFLASINLESQIDNNIKLGKLISSFTKGLVLSTTKHVVNEIDTSLLNTYEQGQQTYLIYQNGGERYIIASMYTTRDEFNITIIPELLGDMKFRGYLLDAFDVSTRRLRKISWEVVDHKTLATYIRKGKPEVEDDNVVF